MTFGSERPPLLSVALISGAALAYEVLLTRIFAVVHWHHLVATAISLALLGYGVSGTFLMLAGERLRRSYGPLYVINAVGFGASALLCVHLAQALSFDPQALAWGLGPLWPLTLTYLLLAIPFFAAANCIGLALWRFPARIPQLYGFDLFGAGLGVLALLLVLGWLPMGEALLLVALTGVLAAAFAAAELYGRRPALLLIMAAGVGTMALWGQIEINPSPFKELSRTLTVLGAEVEQRRFGPTGQLTVVRNDSVPLRHAPGLSLQTGALPPQQLAVFIDGDAHGTLIEQPTPSSLAFLRDLTSALPYTLLEQPQVLILGAGTGLMVLQALQQDARRVIAVESNPLLVELVCERSAGWSATLCDDPRISWQTFDPRAFVDARQAALEHGSEFDLIAITAAAEPAGLNAMDVNFMLTVEGFAEYLAQLTPGGLLAIEGPTRLPPRLAVRMLDTARQALSRHGASDPGQHLAMVRGWQRFALIAARQPLDEAQRLRVRRFAAERGFDLTWLSDLGADETNRYQHLKEPYFFEASRGMLEDSHQSANAAMVRTAVNDDSPFPYRFSRWSELTALLKATTGTASTTPDLGLFLALATLLIATAAGLILIILPLALRRAGTQPGLGNSPMHGWRWRTVVYFSLVGLAFLFVELAWIHRLERFLGQPIYATAFVLATFLVFAGLGSVWSQGPAQRLGRRLLVLAVALIALLNVSYLVWLDQLLAGLVSMPLAGRALVCVLLMAPLAFAMGIPFPLGLQRLGREAIALVPWAWGVNGCASVISASAVPLLAMEAGLSGLVLVGIGCYLALTLVMPQGRTAG